MHVLSLIGDKEVSEQLDFTWTCGKEGVGGCCEKQGWGIQPQTQRPGWRGMIGKSHGKSITWWGGGQAVGFGCLDFDYRKRKSCCLRWVESSSNIQMLGSQDWPQLFFQVATAMSLPDHCAKNREINRRKGKRRRLEKFVPRIVGDLGGCCWKPGFYSKWYGVLKKEKRYLVSHDTKWLCMVSLALNSATALQIMTHGPSRGLSSSSAILLLSDS